MVNSIVSLVICYQDGYWMYMHQNVLRKCVSATKITARRYYNLTIVSLKFFDEPSISLQINIICYSSNLRMRKRNLHVELSEYLVP